MSIDRLSLLEWLLPYCEPNTVCIMYPKGKSDGHSRRQAISDHPRVTSGTCTAPLWWGRASLFRFR